jgi:hypothetical protein
VTDPLSRRHELQLLVTACMSTRERGFAAVLLRVEGTLEVTLFHRNPHSQPVWHMYGYGSPQYLWFAKQPSNPYAARIRAEHDLKANCGLPAAWGH